MALVWPELRAPDADATPFEPMLDALDDLSPRIEAVDRGVALVDVTGLGPLLGTEHRIAARAAALARGVAPLRIRAGIGDTRGLPALAALIARPATADAPLALHRFEPGTGRVALSELPLTLLPADVATRQRFSLFGLTRMGELAALPRSAVGAQFGVAGERLQQLARGEDPRPLVPRRRPERLTIRATFEPPIDGVGAIAFALRSCCADLCERLAGRHLAPGRATLTVRLEDAAPLRVELTFPEPALEPDWIARLLLSRLEQAARRRGATAAEEPRVGGIGLVFDRLSDPSVRQLPAFEVQAARWEELRWSLERMRARFGEGRLWRAIHDRPQAAIPEQRV